MFSSCWAREFQASSQLDLPDSLPYLNPTGTALLLLGNVTRLESQAHWAHVCFASPLKDIYTSDGLELDLLVFTGYSL